MSSLIKPARESLGHRLRDVRKDAGLSGRDLATLAGWHSSKVSKIEYGKQTPSDGDIRSWCRHCDAEDRIPELIAAVRNIETMYVEYRRALTGGVQGAQRAVRALESRARLVRWFEPLLMPGILHTPEYARAVIGVMIEFRGDVDDLEAAVSARMERQSSLYHGRRQFHLIITEQALYTGVGDDDVMVGQLDRLLVAVSLPRVVLGIIPARAEFPAPVHQFTMYDDRLVRMETISARLSINQPQEIALYAKAFDALAGQAVTGGAARELILRALDGLPDRVEE